MIKLHHGAYADPIMGHTCLDDRMVRGTSLWTAAARSVVGQTVVGMYCTYGGARNLDFGFEGIPDTSLIAWELVSER